jgi:hypothetical protein
LVRHDATGIRIFDGIEGSSVVVLPFPSMAAVGQYTIPVVADIANTVFLTGSVIREVNLTGSVNSSVDLIGQVRVA